MKSLLPLLAQESYEPSAGGAIGGAVGFILYIGLIILIIASMWVIYSKAGKPGWAAIVPIYNLVVLLEIIGRPLWWIILALIPFVNIIIIFILVFDLAKSFGKGAGFALGIIFLPFIFYPMLAFGSAQYRGPAAAV